MIGPTGVGKTEIARRLARLAQSPFLKVEASRFTEVGYVGRDVESMIRDLVEIAVGMVRDEPRARSAPRRRGAGRGAAARLAAAARPSRGGGRRDGGARGAKPDARTPARSTPRRQTRRPDGGTRRARQRHAAHASRRRDVDGGDRLNLRDMLPGMFQGRRRPSTMHVPDARAHLVEEEQQKLVDMESVARTAIERVEESGILFVDEIDKIAGREAGTARRQPRGRAAGHPADYRRHDRQHQAWHVRTDHVLFIAAGAFHVSKPSDLIPELQGRFPIRVELDALGPRRVRPHSARARNALIAQYSALLATEGVDLQFTDDAIDRVAELAALVNERMENIGARRLHTVMEKLLDEISFEGPDLSGRSITIDAAYVDRMLADIVKNEDLSRYIL